MPKKINYSNKTKKVNNKINDKVNNKKPNRDRIVGELNFYRSQCKQLTWVNNDLTNKFNQVLESYNGGNVIINGLRIVAEGLTNHVCDSCPLGFAQGEEDCAKNHESEDVSKLCAVHSLLREAEEATKPKEAVKDGAEGGKVDGSDDSPVEGAEAVTADPGASKEVEEVDNVTPLRTEKDIVEDIVKDVETDPEDLN